MVIRIAKVETDSPALPFDSAFDLDAELSEPGFPSGKVSAVNRERHVNGSGPVMGCQGPARNRERMQGLTALEEKQDRGGSGIERREALRGDHRLSAEQGPKEGGGDV